jgi:hypothetical protein
MSLLRRLLGRREAMDQWRSGLERSPSWEPTGRRRAPDADPADVVYTPPRGFDGRPIKRPTGGLTGLEGGGSPYVPDHYKN